MRSKRVLILTAVLVAVAAVAVARLERGPSDAPKVSDAAPDFTLKDLDGKEHSLFALTGSGPVVLVFLRGWVGYQCPLCTAQAGEFLSSADALKAAGARVVFIYPGNSIDIDEHAREFVQRRNLPERFEFLLDPDLKVVKSYKLHWNAAGETTYPATFIITPDRKVAWAKVSSNHGDRASAKDVLAALAKAAPPPATPPAPAAPAAPATQP